ncbi:hypothetical protein QR680_018808 [Steinernema hermaphroditum]|uniref:Serine/threonine-protein phosphatase n=1 Tax=Steinernema hermaphroditum TaxID=289476 RepID=A0AA39LRM9_9BILA|nr:hypothetical protein QR680_018808 [Steinernema hermaphroditum]
MADSNGKHEDVAVTTAKNVVIPLGTPSCDAKKPHPSEEIKKIAQRLRQHALKPKAAKLTVEEVATVVMRVREQLMKDSSMVQPEIPINVVGDIHGQFADLCAIFDLIGDPPQQRYLFLGDYVDRGPFSTETVVLLFCYKLLYPNDVFLLRGNHETRVINKVYGFWHEIARRYSVELWELFQLTFNCLPLCGRISQRVFCMHGGISRDMTSWKQFMNHKKPLEIPDFGIFCDLLWADPDPEVTGYRDSPRGISCLFGEDAVREFCKSMDIDIIVRAHQVVQDGYEFFAGRKLITIFSAPFYCGQFDNAAAILVIDADFKCSFKIRRPTDHNWKKQKPKRASKPKGRIIASVDTEDDEQEDSEVNNNTEDSIADDTEEETPIAIVTKKGAKGIKEGAQKPPNKSREESESSAKLFNNKKKSRIDSIKETVKSSKALITQETDEDVNEDLPISTIKRAQRAKSNSSNAPRENSEETAQTEKTEKTEPTSERAPNNLEKTQENAEGANKKRESGHDKSQKRTGSALLYLFILCERLRGEHLVECKDGDDMLVDALLALEVVVNRDYLPSMAFMVSKSLKRIENECLHCLQ